MCKYCCQDNRIAEDASVFKELTVCRYLMKGDCGFLGETNVKIEASNTGSQPTHVPEISSSMLRE